MSDTSVLVIGHIAVKDEAKWAEYRSQVPATLAPWGAELVFRGKRFEVFGGDHGYTDTVVIRFPSAEASRNWFHSPAYQALIPPAARSCRRAPGRLRALTGKIPYWPSGQPGAHAV